MKNVSLILFFIAIFSSSRVSAQCECPALPADQGTVHTINTVVGLENVLATIDQSNGHATILLEDGIYELNTFIYIKQNMENVSIRSVSGERDAVVIMGSGMTGNVPHVFLVAAKNFILADVTIGWVANHGVQIQGEHDADFPFIQNVRFVNTREQMLKVSGGQSLLHSDGGIVQCCLFEFPDGVAFQYYTGGIDAHHIRDWEIRYNVFKHIRSPDSGLAEHAIHIWSESENTLVENNLIIDCDRGIGFGLGDRGHHGGIIRNNMVHTTRDVGIGLESARAAKIYNNTVVTENYFNSIEFRFDSTYNAHIVNNLTNEDITSRNGGTGTVENNFQTDDNSIYINAGDYDFHLATPVSSIVDAGLFLDEVMMDYDCHARILGDGIDIGADEYDSIATRTDEAQKKHEIEIIPNPNSGLFRIHLPGIINEGILALFDSHGRKVWGAHYTGNYNDQEVILDDISPGLYFLLFSNQAGSISNKVIVK